MRKKVKGEKGQGGRERGREVEEDGEGGGVTRGGGWLTPVLLRATGNMKVFFMKNSFLHEINLRNSTI